MSQTRQHVCSAIFGPDGALEFIDARLGEDDAWNIYLGWPPVHEINSAKLAGFRYSPVVVTEGALAAPAPPPAGVRFDDEGQPI